MRTRIINLLAAALLAFGAGSASAYNIDYSVRGGLQPTYTTSDTITIDVFLDATGPITLFSMGFLSTAGVSYCGACSAALPIVYPAPIYGSNGAQPSYILYAPAAGMNSASILYPQQAPNWLNFPPPPGFEQVNINYAEPIFNSTSATGLNIWIASLVYHINGPFTIEGTFSVSSAVVTDGLNNITDQVTVTGGPIVFFVPEPATALLIGFGLLGLGLVGIRKLPQL